MYIQVQVRNAKDNTAVPGATVQLLDQDLTPLYVGTAANGSGNASFYADDNLPAYYLSVTSIGYKERLIATEQLGAGMIIGLQPMATVLETATVYSHGKSKLTWLLGLGALAVIANDNKKKKVGKIEPGTVAMIAGGLIGFSILKKTLEGLGFWTGAGTKATQAEQTNPNSPWKPAFWKAGPPGELLLTTADFTRYATIIHNAFSVFEDDFNAIMGVFTQLKTQSQVSFLADQFQKIYNEDLLSFLKDGGGILPWDGLSEGHLTILVNLVKNLPQYNTR